MMGHNSQFEEIEEYFTTTYKNHLSSHEETKTMLTTRSCKPCYDQHTNRLLVGPQHPRFSFCFLSLILFTTLLCTSAFRSTIIRHDSVWNLSKVSQRRRRRRERFINYFQTRRVGIELFMADDDDRPFGDDNRPLGDDNRPRSRQKFWNQPLHHRSSDYREEWGVTFEESVPDFPNTVELVVDGAFHAIAGTIYNQQKMDPNVASNARSTNIFTRRPVRNPADTGRIGVEMDGTEFLFPEESSSSSSSRSSSRRNYLSSGRAIRRVALMLAGKLSSKDSWEEYENDTEQVSSSDDDRPVLVCFNTIKQALAASQELKILEAEKQVPAAVYDNIRIQCLSDGIPLDMKLNRTQRRRYRGLSDGYVNVDRGLIIIVQPTDFNAEYSPPGPSVGAVSNFQKVVAQATIEELPVVALSPRFLSNDIPFGGWDQSGYQKSAIYGGIEPPKGPTPWIMRDFFPPVYCWIGNAFTLRKPPRMNDPEVERCHLSRVVVTQSIMDEGHSWHIFAAKDCSHGHRKTPTSFLYLVSTRSASGRPTRELISKILEEI